MLQNIEFTPVWATLLVFIAVVTGHLYRQNWKDEGPRWKAWLYGVLAGGSLLILSFVPLQMQ